MRILLIAALLMVSVLPLAAQNQAGPAAEEVWLQAVGFGFKEKPSFNFDELNAEDKPYTDLLITQPVAPKGKTPREVEKGQLKGIFAMNGIVLPMKIIKSDLAAFEADLMPPISPDAGGDDKGGKLKTPIGHLSMQITIGQRDIFIEGKAKVKLEDMPQYSGVYRIFQVVKKENALPKPGEGSGAGSGDEKKP